MYKSRFHISFGGVRVHHRHMKPVLLRLLGLFLIWAVICVFSGSSTYATVTNVAWYRLGENDPGARSGNAVTNTTADLVGPNHLKQFGSPLYSTAVSAGAASQLKSSFAVNFNGTSQYLSNTVVSTAVNNFGIEAWVKPNATAAGNRTIVFNGSSTVSGWGFIQHGGTEYVASLGGVTSFGSGTAAAGVWTHLALVRSSGTTTFYVDGVVSGTSVSAPIQPATSFIVAAHPQFLANTFFNGAIDEVRVFTFGPSQFTTNDLLLNVQRVVTGPATGLSTTNTTLNGTANPLGLTASGWFQWGTTTNYGYVTPAQPLGAGIVNTNFAQQLTGLALHAYHYRAVASNALGVATGNDVVFTPTNGVMTASGSAGGGQPFDARQPSLELNYIICTNGTYPSENGGFSPPFFGEVRLFAGNFAPAGWQFCHGQLIYVTNNETLYSLIGTTYGGDGTTTYGLPDLRSRTIAGTGQGPGLTSIALSQTAGTLQSTILLPSMPAHAHALPLPYGVSGSAGSSQPRLNRQPLLGLSCLIVLLGAYPAQQTAIEPVLAQMLTFAGNFAPKGTALAQGQLLPISQNQALFSLLGTLYGGNGQTLFGLPDMRGRCFMTEGQGAGLSVRSMGEKPGVETVTMSIGQLPVHQHTLPTVPPLNSPTGTAGSNQPQTLVQPSTVIRFLISTNGALPSRFVEATVQMIGEIQAFAGGPGITPGGWTPCNGQLLSATAYPALFSVISNFFGGDGVTTFALPNLSGRIPVGSPTGQPGAVYGVEEFVLTEAQLPAHTHSVPRLDFQGWCDSLGLTGDFAAFDSDADGDGVKNGFEWATGTNPTNAASFTPLTIGAVGQQAKLRFARNTNATDITIHLQRTVALGNSNAWSGIVTNIAGSWISPTIVSETGVTNPKPVEVSDALTNNTAADYRLKITRP